MKSDAPVMAKHELPTAMPPEATAARIAAILAALGAIVLDQREALRLALACVLARGHLLIEDLPGTGKTLLAHALARVLGLEFHRVQFTSDLLPGDLLGASVWQRERGEFTFHPGPVFTHLLLADEVNRASPKTQSALLEAMEERQVSSDGVTRALPDPFFVIATQNPVDRLSTHPLPEAQLDRFLMRLSLGWLGREAELDVLRGEDRRVLLAATAPVTDVAQLRAMQAAAACVRASEPLLAYLHALLDATRHDGRWRHGLSTRAGQALLAASRAFALIEGRDHVIPADVQAVFVAVAAHRLAGHDEPAGAARAVDALLADVAIP